MNSISNAAKFRFWQALAVSLALHALLLAQTLPLAPISSASVPLAATLQQAARHASAGLIQAEAPIKQGSRVAVASAEAVSAPAPVAEAVAPAASRGAAAGSETREVAPTTARAGLSQGSPTGPDANSLRLYRFSLAAAARGFKRYPAAAVERGLSGRVEVSLSVAANGLPLAPQLVASSGSSLLDQAAVDMVARAAQATALPASLRGAAFAVNLPVEFDLSEQ